VNCEFMWQTDQEGGVGRCERPALFDVRWHYADDGPTDDPSEGSMCEEHIVIACEQLVADREVVAGSIQLRRREELTR
jgi:hypothetical protein